MLATSLILGNSQGNGGRERPCASRTPLCRFLQHAADTRLRMVLIVPKIRSSSARVSQADRERGRERGPAEFRRLVREYFAGWPRAVPAVLDVHFPGNGKNA